MLYTENQTNISLRDFLKFPQIIGYKPFYIESDIFYEIITYLPVSIKLNAKNHN